MRQLRFCCTMGTDCLWIYHLQDARDGKAREITRSTVSETSCPSNKKHQYAAQCSERCLTVLKSSGLDVVVPVSSFGMKAGLERNAWKDRSGSIWWFNAIWKEQTKRRRQRYFQMLKPPSLGICFSLPSEAADVIWSEKKLSLRQKIWLTAGYLTK